MSAALGSTPRRLRLLLIQPENRRIHEFRRRQLNNFAQVTMPYLAGYVDQSAYEVALVDEYHDAIPYAQDWDLVALTVNTPNASHCYDISERFRGRGIAVVMGGPHATLLPDEVGAWCDHLVVGEAESTWPEFLADFARGRAQPRYQSTRVPTLAGIPRPRWDLLRRSRTMKSAVVASRGCPYRCRYCNLKQIYHDALRTRPVAEVVAELAVSRSRFFVFWDDNLFADRGYAERLLRAVAPLRRRWAAQVTLRDCDDEELLQLARQAGCQYLFIGLETFSAGSLKDAGKRINPLAQYDRIIGAIHAHGIMVQAGIVFGFDSDTVDVFSQTLSACERLGIDGVTASMLIPLPGTPIHRQFAAEGRLLTKDWTAYDGKTAVAFQPAGLTVDQLMAGYAWFRRNFYSLRSFLRRMRVSRTRPLVNFVMNLGYWRGVRAHRN
ncbi:MAG: B12-binding domain-containing radical SAM protein [Propionibacteriaceae bacterium]|jgi:radical SAM superfamily enzyme YgiQ (UPF0313 family)|nr:B12-binding domain-containing radical SAM protein [Propionibacteriaceae bacterium]